MHNNTYSPTFNETLHYSVYTEQFDATIPTLFPCFCCSTIPTCYYLLLHFYSSIMCLHKELSNPCVYQWLLLGNQF